MADPIAPSAEQTALLGELPADQPLVMVNLLQFRQPDGLAHFQRYARGVGEQLAAVGARPLYGGTARAVVIGDSPRPWWDAILVVEYPSPAAFLQMVGEEAYGEVHVHRAATLERTELIATSVWAPQG